MCNRVIIYSNKLLSLIHSILETITVIFYLRVKLEIGEPDNATPLLIILGAFKFVLLAMQAFLLIKIFALTCKLLIL